jgi:hypothetical protein
MSVEDRLTIPGAGDDGIMLAPSGISRITELSHYGIGPLRTIDADSDMRDIRPNLVVYIDLADVTAADLFNIKVQLNGANMGTTANFVAGTNMTAAAIQAALRTLLPADTTLTVTGTTDVGPFIVTFTKTAYLRHFPKLTFPVQTGMSATLYRTPTRPDQIQTLTLASVAGGDLFNLALSLNGVVLGTTVNFVAGTNMTAAAIQAALRTLLPSDTSLTVSGTTDVGPFIITFTRSAYGDRYPVITSPVQTGMTCVISLNAGAWPLVEGLTSIQELGESGKVSTSVTLSKPTIGTITVTPGVAEVQTITHTGVSAGTFTVKYKGRYSDPLQWNITAANLQIALRALHPDLAAVVVASDVSPRTVTFAGRGRPENILTLDTAGLVGGTFVVTQSTPGLFGTISVAYTENDGGDSVLIAAINDVTGDSFGFQNDAATPAVIGATTGLQGLTPGPYHVVARTVKSGRVSNADNKAFTMTSS